MNRFLFAVAVVVLFAGVSYSEDQPAVTPMAPPPVPVVTPSTPTYTSTTSTTTRRGLFSRLRNRNTMTYSSAPLLMSSPMPAAPMPSTVAPQPMPSSKPTGSAPMTGTVVQASGSLPPGTYTTTDGMVVQVGGTEMQTSRRGLMSRLRMR